MWKRDFRDLLARDVGEAFLAAFSAAIVRGRMHETWTSAEQEHQLIRRGRYVEFNLIHDRGTLFGLKTGGMWRQSPHEPAARGEVAVTGNFHAAGP